MSFILDGDIFLTFLNRPMQKESDSGGQNCFFKNPIASPPRINWCAPNKYRVADLRVSDLLSPC